MSSPQTPSTTNWPFPITNDVRSKESQDLIDGKHYKTKETLDTNDYEEALF